MTKLTPKQKAFVDYYIETGNATEAARLAGYSKKTANRIATENLSKPVIQKTIQECMSKKESERIASGDEVLRLLTEIMRGETIESLITATGIKIENTPSIRERIRAAELIGKRYALFTERNRIDLVEAPKIIDDIIVGVMNHESD